MAQLFKNRENWLSAHVLCRTNAIRVDGGVIRIGGAWPEHHVDAVTVVVIMNDHSLHNTFTSLANIVYANYRVLFVSRSKEKHDECAPLVASYGHVIPMAGFFRPEKDLSIGEAIMAALQSVETPYVCFMFNGDMIHPTAISKAVGSLRDTGKAYCTDLGFIVTGDGWATVPDLVRLDTQLMFFKRDSAIRHLADAPAIEYPLALLWHLLGNLKTEESKLSEHLYFRAVLNFTEYQADNEAYRGSPYFRGGD